MSWASVSVSISIGIALLAGCGQRLVVQSDGGALDSRLPARESGFRGDDGGYRPPDASRLPPCMRNDQCLPTEYCNLDNNCHPDGSEGTCTPKPTDGCTQQYAPVCGCDNKTYGNDCEAHAAGRSVDYRGTCCSELSDQYLALVAAARQCCAACAAAIDPCHQVVNGELACPCPTTVNAGAPELTAMSILAQRWADQDCSNKVDCLAGDCPKLSGGSCQPAAGGPGLCVDNH